MRVDSVFQSGRGWGRSYFGVQAAAGTLWWTGVFAVPGVREATLGRLDPVLVAAFDLPLFVVASALVALGMRAAVWAAVPWTVLVACGMVVYATLTGLAGWGALLMIAAAAGSTVASVLVLVGRLPSERVIVGPFAFRASRASGTLSLVARTGAQTAVFWGLFLVVIPLVIVTLERSWGLSVEMPEIVRLAGAAILAAASALGVWSALVMSARGRGTPLPAAMPRRLVVGGPYRFVRNPMAVAGIAQGVGVGLAAGSWLVVLYALSGSLVWNWVVRPLEEADLAARFGADYDDYRERVSCWVPRRQTR